MYALHKFLLSCQIYSPDVRSLDPAEGVHFAISRFFEDHVTFAYAIISAYSVVEELGLEVRASKEQPSHGSDGRWNSAVLSELQGRLRDSNVNFSEPIPWHLRGTPTRLERAKRPELKGKLSWTRGPIRDREMEIVDAINHASWLRSKISSHRLTKAKLSPSSLSPYDVANVQHLARRLLLERLGFWTQLGA